MLKLGNPEAGWQDVLPGVRVNFAPIGRKAVKAARLAVSAALKRDVNDISEAGDALSRELIRRGIIAWEGVTDLNGDPVEPTQDKLAEDDQGNVVLDSDGNPVVEIVGTISQFIADNTAFEAADQVYVKPWSEREREKNGWSGSPNGTSTEATPEPDTASSPAGRRKKAGADPTLRPSKAGARISSTSPRQKKLKASGK